MGSSVETRVKRIVAEVTGVDESEIKRESKFIDDLGVESLDIVEMIAAMEEEFDIEIPEEEAEKNITVGQAIDYIEKKLREKGTSGSS